MKFLYLYLIYCLLYLNLKLDGYCHIKKKKKKNELLNLKINVSLNVIFNIKVCYVSLKNLSKRIMLNRKRYSRENAKRYLRLIEYRAKRNKRLVDSVNESLYFRSKYISIVITTLYNIGTQFVT